MSPSSSCLQDETSKFNKNAFCPPLLKINKDSHSIKKSSSSLLSSSPPSSYSASSLAVSGTVKPPPQRTPVIIYTHSPKIIHTDPRDFMALVQKLTGMRSDDDHAPDHQIKRELPDEESYKNGKMIGGNDDNESSSVVTTDENCGDGQVNSSSCFVPPIFEAPNPYMTSIPVFTPNSAEFLCGNQPYNYNNYTDPLYFNNPNMRISISSSTSSPMEAINDFPEY